MSSSIPTVRALVFDLDDTLYPEIDYIRSGFQVVAGRLADSKHDVHAVFDLLWQIFENGPRDRVFNLVLEQLGQARNPQIIAELVNLYRSHRPVLRLDPVIKALLDQFHRHVKLGLLTDGYLPAQRLKVETLGLEHAFDHIIYTEELGREFWKPAPAAFERMAVALGAAHHECVYIADNPGKDFVAPNRLGWQTVQIQLPERVHRAQTAVPNGNPQHVITRLTDLSHLVTS